MDWGKRVDELGQELYRLQGELLPENPNSELEMLNPAMQDRLDLLFREIDRALYLAGRIPSLKED